MSRLSSAMLTFAFERQPLMLCSVDDPADCLLPSMQRRWRDVVEERRYITAQLKRCIYAKRLAMQQFKYWFWRQMQTETQVRPSLRHPTMAANHVSASVTTFQS